MSDKLKRCPFCGCETTTSKPEIGNDLRATGTIIRSCLSCGVTQRGTNNWISRPIKDELQSENDRLKVVNAELAIKTAYKERELLNQLGTLRQLNTELVEALDRNMNDALEAIVEGNKTMTGKQFKGYLLRFAQSVRDRSKQALIKAEGKEGA